MAGIKCPGEQAAPRAGKSAPHESSRAPASGRQTRGRSSRARRPESASPAASCRASRGSCRGNRRCAAATGDEGGVGGGWGWEEGERVATSRTPEDNRRPAHLLARARRPREPQPQLPHPLLGSFVAPSAPQPNKQPHAGADLPLAGQEVGRLAHVGHAEGDARHDGREGKVEGRMEHRVWVDGWLSGWGGGVSGGFSSRRILRGRKDLLRRPRRSGQRPGQGATRPASGRAPVSIAWA